jgi:hypothetical protein
MSSSIPPDELSKYAPKWVREGTTKPRDTVSLPPAPQLETMPSEEPPWRGPSPFAGDVRQWRLRPSAVPQVVREAPARGSRRQRPSFVARFFKTAAVVSFAVIATGALGLLLFPSAPREGSQVRSTSILASLPQAMSQHDKTAAGKSVARPAASAPPAQTTATAKPVGSTIYVVANTAAPAQQPQVQQPQVQQPQTQTLQVQEPQLQQVQIRAAAPSTSSLAPQRVHSERILSPDELDKLITRGEKFIEQGDVSAARLVLERAAQARDPRAALALGSTYDPNVLGRLGVVGVQPEPEKARTWYEKAAEFGSGEANQRLTALAQLAR